MTEMMSRVESTEDSNPAAQPDGLDEELINQLVDRAKAGGLQLTGEGGVLQQLTKRLLESALDGVSMPVCFGPSCSLGFGPSRRSEAAG